MQGLTLEGVVYLGCDYGREELTFLHALRSSDTPPPFHVQIDTTVTHIADIEVTAFVLWQQPAKLPGVLVLETICGPNRCSIIIQTKSAW